MLGDSFVKLPTVLNPDDVEQIVSLGLENEVVDLLSQMGKILATFQDRGLIGDEAACKVDNRLFELWAAYLSGRKAKGGFKKV